MLQLVQEIVILGETHYPLALMPAEGFPSIIMPAEVFARSPPCKAALEG